MAGNNVRFDLWHFTFPSDDDVGGAQPSGTVLYTSIQGRFQAQPASQLLLQQGLETERTYTAWLIPGTLNVRERDELELVEPFDHHYHGDRFRIIRVQYSDHNPRDPRNYILVYMIRSVEAHGSQ